MSLIRYLEENVDDTYRVCVLGSSGTGKTVKVGGIISEHIKWSSGKNPVFIFTFYKGIYDDPYPSSRLWKDPNENSIKEAMELVKKSEGITGVCKPQFVFIFDDVVDERLSKSAAMADLFLTSRKSRINIVFVIQTFTVFLTPHMKNNLTHYVLFPLFEMNHQKRIVNEIIAPCYMGRYRGSVEDATKKAKMMADRLYGRLFANKYSHIIVDVRNRQINE